MNRATDRITVSPVVSSTKFIFQTGDWCYIFVGNKQYKEYIYIYIYWYETHPPSPRSPCNKRKMRPGIPWRWGSWLWNEMLFVVHARLEKVKRKEFRQVLQFNFTLFYLFFFVCLFVSFHFLLKKSFCCRLSVCLSGCVSVCLVIFREWFVADLVQILFGGKKCPKLSLKLHRFTCGAQWYLKLCAASFYTVRAPL